MAIDYNVSKRCILHSSMLHITYFKCIFDIMKLNDTRKIACPLNVVKPFLNKRIKYVIFMRCCRKMHNLSFKCCFILHILHVIALSDLYIFIIVKNNVSEITDLLRYWSVLDIKCSLH